MPPTKKDRKKDDFITLEQANMIVSTYEVKLPNLFHYATQLVSSEEESIRQFVKGLNKVASSVYAYDLCR